MLLAEGKIYKEKKYFLDLDSTKVSNPHILIAGASGSGKTTLLRKVIRYYREHNKTVFIIDFHGDLKTENENTLVFTPRNSPNGINPFELELDEAKGGVNVQAEIIATMFGTYFMDKIGSKQRGLLKQLIVDLYGIFGIFDYSPSTWTKKTPTMHDFGEYCNEIDKYIDVVKNGFTTENIPKTLEAIIKKVKKIHCKENIELLDEIVKNLSSSKEDLSSLLESIDDNYEKNVFESSQYKHINIEEYVRNARILDSLFVYIREAAKMSIFYDAKPILRKGINRFDFSAFVSIDKPLIAKFLSEFIAQRLFRSCMLRGEYADLNTVQKNTKFDRVLVIDESKLAMPQGKEKDNPYNVMNRITSESRKYGLGLCIVSQRLSHYTDEILSNIFTKIILRVKPFEYIAVAKALGVDVALVKDAFDSQEEYPAIIETFGANRHIYNLTK